MVGDGTREVNHFRAPVLVTYGERRTKSSKLIQTFETKQTLLTKGPRRSTFPGMPAHRARKLDPFAVARSILRPHLYVGLLDAAATTGYLPHLDRFGRLDPNVPMTPLDSDQRLLALKYLTDKSLATPKAEEGEARLDLDTALRDLRALTAGELSALSGSTTDVDPADIADANPLAAAPAPGPSGAPGAGPPDPSPT